MKNNKHVMVDMGHRHKRPVHTVPLHSAMAVTVYDDEELVVKHRSGLSTSEVVSKLCKTTGIYPRYFHNAPDDLKDNKLLQDCCDYAKKLGWSMDPAMEQMSGPLGGYEFRRKYEGRQWAGGGYSIQSISCIMASCARKRFPLF